MLAMGAFAHNCLETTSAAAAATPHTGCKGTRVAPPESCTVGRDCSWTLALYDADDEPALTGGLLWMLLGGDDDAPAEAPALTLTPTAGGALGHASWGF